jgi:hypothetical protein
VYTEEGIGVKVVVAVVVVENKIAVGLDIAAFGTDAAVEANIGCWVFGIVLGEIGEVVAGKIVVGKVVVAEMDNIAVDCLQP